MPGRIHCVVQFGPCLNTLLNHPFMKTAASIGLLLFVFATSSAHAQRKNIDKRVENEVKRKIDQKADRAIDKALNKADKKIDKEVSEAVNKSTGDKKETASDKIKGTGTPTGETQQYDFVPGEKILFYDDFAMDAKADFPAKWNTNGS